MSNEEFRNIVDAAFTLSEELGDEVKRSLLDGGENLEIAEAKRLLHKIVVRLKESAERRGDEATLAALSGSAERIVESILAGAENGAPPRPEPARTRSSAPPEPEWVKPVPIFHGRKVPVHRVKMRTEDIQLWPENERLEIHIEQFRSKEGRDPDPGDLLAIMHSTLDLPGVVDDSDDQFKIVPLAQDIAYNGVQRPPILDNDGTLLDGNRRVAACYYILHSDEFPPEAKQMAQEIYIWQLTDMADEDDRTAVIVALNFAADHKLPWPEYVKARRVAERFDHLRLLQPNATVKTLKRRVAKEFAIGVATVSRYLLMVDWATDFEEYQTEERRRDLHEVQHKSNHYFQYFKELSDGRSEGGVAWTLGQDPDYKKLVFDLLFDGKFRKWEQVRLLKHRDEELDRDLAKVADEDVRILAMQNLDSALARAHERHLDTRRAVGANQQIEHFVKFIRKVPLESFHNGDISREKLDELVEVLEWVRAQAQGVRDEPHAAETA